MIETADTDYAADYDTDYAADDDTDYERPIMSRYFDKKSPKKLFHAKIFQRPFLVVDHK